MPRKPTIPHTHSHPCVAPSPVSSSDTIKLQVILSKITDNLTKNFIPKDELKTINGQSLVGEGDLDIILEGTPGPKGDKGDQGDQGPVGPKGDDGLTTAIKIGENLYTQDQGVISLPEDLFSVTLEKLAEVFENTSLDGGEIK